MFNIILETLSRVTTRVHFANFKWIFFASLILGLTSPSFAATVVANGIFYPVPIPSNLLNTDITTWTQGSTYNGYMAGIQNFNGVPFSMQTNSSGKNVIWTTSTYVFSLGSATYTNTATLNTSIYGATTVYTLINDAYGSAGKNVGSVTFNASDGTSYTVNLIVGLNVRDHYTGSVPSASYVTINVLGSSSGAHLDMQAFTLPSSFATKQLSSIVFISTGSSSTGMPYLAGVTVDATTNVIPSNFNCTIIGGTSNTGHLYTQVAGTPFSIDVIALKSTGAVETSYVTSGTKNVTLEFVDGSGTTACASRAALSPAVSQTVSFAASDAGRKTVSGIIIAKAYRDLRCRVTDANQTPSVVGCSSDDFAVRPASFTVTSTNANADGAGASVSATPAIKTGANFNLTAATGVIGYDGTPSIDTSKINAHTGAIQAGTLSGSFSAANSTTGSATGSSITYSEVGYFNLSANGVYDSIFTTVDSASGDCNPGFTASGSLNACSFGNSSVTNYFGRFIPDHFAIATGAATPACSNSFSYFGQDGLTTVFTLTAQNSTNAITKNYTGSFARLGLTSWANYNFSASPLPTGAVLSASATAPSGAWSSGSASITAKHQISRPSSATAPTSITISTAPMDSDGVTMSSLAVSSASSFKYGRLYMPNSYGSELLPLSVPIEAQYWNGSAYQRSQQDSCSIVPVSSIAMGNYQSNLSTCETALTGAGALSAGKTTATLSKPGNGNNGSVDLTVNLNSASGSTCTPTSTAATSAGIPWFGTNLSSRATFGRFKTPLIYFRENF